MKTSDLPAFFDVLDGHILVRDSEAETANKTLARDWVDGLESRWAGSAMEAPYIVPLAKVIERVALLTGERPPKLDPAEGDSATVLITEGFDGDG